MNKVTTSEFHKAYATFGILFLLLNVSVIGFLLLDCTVTKLGYISIIVIYSVLIIVLVISFLFVLKSKITKIIESIDQIIDNAINKREDMYISYEETTLSALEKKIYRFITMSKSTIEVIDEERNKIKSLISDISHQTKTPIANILLYAELLLDSFKLNQDEKQLANEIKFQSEKLRWLIQSLVKMSRLEVGIISDNKKLMPIFKTISNSLRVVFSSAEKRNICIEVCCDEKIKTYHDGKWISEALTNIIENAIKYTSENGKIHIVVNQYDMFTRIDISDTGIGIDKSEFNNIFKRFYRSDKVSQYEGVGLGLYLTREIISSQGGYIRVKSELNKGSVFSVFLPNNMIVPE